MLTFWARVSFIIILKDPLREELRVCDIRHADREMPAGEWVCAAIKCAKVSPVRQDEGFLRDGCARAQVSPRGRQDAQQAQRPLTALSLLGQVQISPEDLDWEERAS